MLFRWTTSFCSTISLAFVFEFLPLSVRTKCFPLNVMPAISGNAGQDPKERIDHIVAALGNLVTPVYIWFVATDGDAGYNERYQK
jgi:hypothetical protein